MLAYRSMVGSGVEARNPFSAFSVPFPVVIFQTVDELATAFFEKMVED